MDYKNNSNTGLIIVADCMLLSVEYIGNVHLFFNMTNGHFSSYEGHMERRTGKMRGAFLRMHRALDGWMLARAPASPAQGLHHHGPRYFNFPYFCTMCGLEKLGIVDQNWLERLSDLLLRTLVVGRRQQSESIEAALDGVKEV